LVYSVCGHHVCSHCVIAALQIIAIVDDDDDDDDDTAGLPLHIQ